MKRLIFLAVMTLCLALPVATLVVPAAHADSTTVIKNTETNNNTTVDRTTTDTDLAAPTDSNTNRILLWGGVILVAALIIGLAMHNRSDSVTHTDVHVD
jgi:hypothetical protein